MHKFETLYPTLAKTFRYLVAGGLATLTNLVAIYVFTDLLGIRYLISAVLSFIIGFFVSFFLQKYWTFREMSRELAHVQMVKFLIVSVINLGINTLLMYVFVDLFGVQYLVAQFLVSAIIALLSFFVYKKFVFKAAA